MAGKTVIDQLVVEFGLDPKKFTAGQKEVMSGLKDMQNQAKRTGEDTEKSAEKSDSAFAALGKRVLTVAAIFKVLSYTTRTTLEAARATYALSNASRQLGENSRMLRNFENIGEIFGSTAASVTKSVQGIKQAVHDLAFNGQMSQQLVQLGRLGVQFQNRDGRARDFKDIYLDTAGALQRGVSSGTFTESDALMMAESAGFDPGLARSMVGGREGAALALARQEARRQVSAEDIAAATANEQAVTSAGQAKDTAFTAAQTKASGFITGTAGTFENAWTKGATGDLAGAWEALTEPVQAGLRNLAESADKASVSIGGWVRSMAGKGRAGYELTIQNAAKRYGIPAETLAGVLNVESRFDPAAANPSGAVGIAQLKPEFFPGAGVDPMADIETAAKYLAKLHGSFVKSGSSDGDAWDKALMSYNGGERRVRTSNVFGDGSSGRDLTGETISYPGQVYEYAMSRDSGGGGGTTNVDIAEVNVITSATDANGMATGAADALKRKLTAAQVDQGMQ